VKLSGKTVALAHLFCMAELSVGTINNKTKQTRGWSEMSLRHNWSGRDTSQAIIAFLSKLLGGQTCPPDSHNGGGGAPQIIDPLDTTMIAPPKPAAPIASLPDGQLVTRAANRRE